MMNVTSACHAVAAREKPANRKRNRVAAILQEINLVIFPACARVLDSMAMKLDLTAFRSDEVIAFQFSSVASNGRMKHA